MAAKISLQPYGGFSFDHHYNNNTFTMNFWSWSFYIFNFIQAEKKNHNWFQIIWYYHNAKSMSQIRAEETVQHKFRENKQIY